MKMSIYMTEDEQIAVIKNWLQKNFWQIIFFVFVGVGFSLGFQFWKLTQTKMQEQASNAYENLIVAVSKNNIKAVRNYANILVNSYPKTEYAIAAHLTLAKWYVNKQKYSAARDELEYILKHYPKADLTDIAKIRLARLLISEEVYERALTVLSRVNNDAYKPVIHELTGDIYAKTERAGDAIKMYTEAIDEVHKDGMGNLFLEMKMTNLGNQVKQGA
jgi:predicted negative regulator of RcsB-dependent stress response